MGGGRRATRREQVIAINPPLFDIPVWVPATGRFERHAGLDTLPMGLFPTEAADLPLILPNKAPVEIDRIAMAYSGRSMVTQSLPGTQYQYNRLWWHLRHMAVTHPRGTSPTFIPKVFTSQPLPRARRPVGRPFHKNRSGSNAPDSKYGMQNFELLYTPGAIESRDLAFVELPPQAQEIVRGLLRKGNKKFTRIELASAVLRPVFILG